MWCCSWHWETPAVAQACSYQLLIMHIRVRLEAGPCEFVVVRVTLEDMLQSESCICGGQSDTAGHVAVWELHLWWSEWHCGTCFSLRAPFLPCHTFPQLSTLICHESQHWVLQQQCLVDMTVHCLLSSKNWVFGKKNQRNCLAQIQWDWECHAECEVPFVTEQAGWGVSCWMWSSLCYWASWLGSVMLTVKFPFLLSKLAGDCHADCEVPYVTEQSGWGVSCWLWSSVCYWACWLGSIMLTVKFPVLLSKLAGECHADCEVPCVT